MNVPKLVTLVPILGILLVGCFELPSASTPSTPVSLPKGEFDEYWTQLERRWPVFFESQCLPTPELPNREDIRSWVSFVEVPHAFLSTCTFTKATGRIRIGDDKWQGGCVPHELGHAACEALGQPDGCRWFEHKQDKRWRDNVRDPC